MKKLNAFEKWYKKLGGNMVNINVEETFKKLNNPILRVSTLKNRATEIKEKFNYQFKTK